MPIYTDPAKSVSKLSVSLIPTVTSEPPNPPRGNGSSPPPLASKSSDGSAFSPALHVFGATLLLSSDDQAGRGVQVTGARASHRFWQDDGGSGAPAGPLDAASRANAQLSPVILLRLANLGNSPLSSVTVHLNGSQISTIHPGQLAYLAPGHMATLEVGIEPSIASANAADVTILVYDSANGTLLLQQDVTNLAFSLQNHHAPTWFKQAKFGIFVHWGLYSVPAWAPVGKEYAEWYWYQMNHENDPTYAHHKKTYGEQFAYDDFIPLWQPNAFDPKAWLDVIDRSRATYFVFTSKHHDGYALFDTSKVSNRSSVSMHPHHDFVGDLITTAKQSYPHLKRGIYFSLPEWYNPSYHGIDNLDDWHGPPTNPYTHATVPYTGNPHIKDFVNDLQVPQFLELVHQYEPDILWCDIGGINNSSHWQVDFFNRASAQGRQVTINDRCGNGISDFSTLEYQSTAAPPPRQWEATRGIDPRSFGFNQATPPEDYASSKELLHDLIDAVAMGGNFLLNIGPMANGSIHWVMTDRLNAMGAWLDIHGASIFDTEPYWQTSQDQDVRYTMSRDGSTFYILLFAGHPSLVSLRTPLPLQPHSTLSVMGGAAASQLNWHVRERDHVIYTDIDLPPLDSTLATVISCKLF
ncbi:alpha-L-fucosidase-domain-containing protein [Gongronella butleri]|nr:alpha-L-fucosidase-domain-containing protein [Gongronella butleri]